MLRKCMLVLALVLVGLYSPSQTIDMMSFNIRYDNPNDNENAWDNRKAELLNLIKYYHPDFLGIQEGLYSQVEYLNSNISDYQYIGVGREDGDKKGEYAAIFYDQTKYKLIESKTFWLSDTPNQVSVGWDASMERICTYGCFKNLKTREKIHIFNAHFDHLGEEARRKSAILILAKTLAYRLSSKKFVIMGDFNALPDSETITELKEAIDDGKVIAERPFHGPLGTFNQFNKDIVPDQRIDYIFTHNMQVLSYRHIDDRRLNQLCISDHLPVFIRIRK